jgi:hypothetical protein
MTGYLGIDWSEQKYQLCFIYEAGDVIQQLRVDHGVKGFLISDISKFNVDLA